MSKTKQNISDLKPFQSAVLSLEGELKARGEKPEMPLTFMPELSNKIWGVHRRKMMVIGARTSNGKSVLAINIAWDLVLQGKKVVFLSLEMPVERITERLFCLDKYVDNIELLKNGYNKHQYISSKYQEFKKRGLPNFVLSDCLGKDWNFIDQILQEISSKPDVVIIDHIQEIRGTVSQKQAIDEHISKMRESAIRNNFALIVCSQVNRLSQTDKEDKEPQLHHLKATGFLEESADQVLLLFWPWHYDNEKNKNDFYINVAKNRDGLTGRIKMFFKPEYYRLHDFAGEELKTQEPIKKNFTESDVEWTE